MASIIFFFYRVNWSSYFSSNSRSEKKIGMKNALLNTRCVVCGGSAQFSFFAMLYKIFYRITYTLNWKIMYKMRVSLLLFMPIGTLPLRGEGSVGRAREETRFFITKDRA